MGLGWVQSGFGVVPAVWGRGRLVYAVQGRLVLGYLVWELEG